MITIMPWSLCAKTHPGGEVVSDVITFCLRSGHHCSLACLTWTAWSSCFIMLYCPWNPVLYKVTWFPMVCLAIIWLPKTAHETTYSILSCTCWGSRWGWGPARGNFFRLGHAELVLVGRTWACSTLINVMWLLSINSGGFVVTRLNTNAHKTS